MTVAFLMKNTLDAAKRALAKNANAKWNLSLLKLDPLPKVSRN